MPRSITDQLVVIREILYHIHVSICQVSVMLSAGRILQILDLTGSLLHQPHLSLDMLSYFRCYFAAK